MKLHLSLLKCSIIGGAFTLSLVLSSCNNASKQSSSVSADSMVSVGDFYMDTNEINGGEAYRQYYPRDCHFDTVYNRPATSDLARKIFRTADWDMSDNNGIWFVDSLKSKDIDARAFYFKVVTQMQSKLDGTFSEAFCMNATEYVEKNTEQFISYFDNAACFSETDLDTWASIVAGEYGIIEDSTDVRIALNKLYAGYRTYNEKSTKAHDERIERFIKMIEDKLW